MQDCMKKACKSRRHEINQNEGICCLRRLTLHYPSARKCNTWSLKTSPADYINILRSNIKASRWKTPRLTRKLRRSVSFMFGGGKKESSHLWCLWWRWLIKGSMSSTSLPWGFSIYLPVHCLCLNFTLISFRNRIMLKTTQCPSNGSS